ncbi:MAG: deoxyribodipyrimidine photo-lyase [Spirochaetaceae bacterium]|nr:deoxyribodipyrimidine photo-lyase [Spirochaetaceae bacterium]
MIEAERVVALLDRPTRAGAVYGLYWMQAAQRVEENHALSYAAAMARDARLPLAILFVLAEFPRARAPHYAWMLSGLRETAREARAAGYGFFIRRGDPAAVLREVAANAAFLVCDAAPGRWACGLKAELAADLELPIYEVDGESVVPGAVAPPKQEWSARTFRAKIAGAVPHYLDAPPLALAPPARGAKGAAGIELPSEDALLDGAAFAAPAAAVAPTTPAALAAPAGAPWTTPPSGPVAARAALVRFLERGLPRYEEGRNDPNAEAGSGLSPYLHFGQISPLAVARSAARQGGPGTPAFLEQLVVRRELCRNFVLHRGADYDEWEGLPEWARKSLLAHADDKRAYRYTADDFAAGRTHDPYWNAAQAELTRTGTIHNYMRMYWGKMILAWSADPRVAFRTAIELNDRLALDGRDPNGWAGVAWCFGLHDRPWPERPVFGLVRAMAASGLERRFDVRAYARRWLGQSPPPVGRRGD